jgi:hypothetical protein
LVGKGITALAQPTERIGVAAFESLLGRFAATAAQPGASTSRPT